MAQITCNTWSSSEAFPLFLAALNSLTAFLTSLIFSFFSFLDKFLNASTADFTSVGLGSLLEGVEGSAKAACTLGIRKPRHSARASMRVKIVFIEEDLRNEI